MPLQIDTFKENLLGILCVGIIVAKMYPEAGRDMCKCHSKLKMLSILEPLSIRRSLGRLRNAAQERTKWKEGKGWKER